MGQPAPPAASRAIPSGSSARFVAEEATGAADFIAAAAAITIAAMRAWLANAPTSVSIRDPCRSSRLSCLSTLADCW